jgi:hypothetical protein
MLKLELIAVIALWSAASACGASDPGQLITAGQSALACGDSQTALSKFRAALAEFQPGAPGYVEARLCIVEALIPNNPNEAMAEFRLLSNQYPQQFGESQFVYVAGQLVSSQHYEVAAQLTCTALQRFGAESSRLEVLMRRIKEEEAMNTPVQGRLTGFCTYGSRATTAPQ